MLGRAAQALASSAKKRKTGTVGETRRRTDETASNSCAFSAAPS